MLLLESVRKIQEQAKDNKLQELEETVKCHVNKNVKQRFLLFFVEKTDLTQKNDEASV